MGPYIPHEKCEPQVGDSLARNDTTYKCMRERSVTSVVFQLFATLVECSLSGASAHGILQARILEWVVMAFSRGSSQPGGQTCVPCSSCIAGIFSTVELNSNPSSVALEYLLLASTLYCLFCYQKGRRIHLKLI